MKKDFGTSLFARGISCSCDDLFCLWFFGSLFGIVDVEEINLSWVWYDIVIAYGSLGSSQDEQCFTTRLPNGYWVCEEKGLRSDHLRTVISDRGYSIGSSN